MAGSTLSNTHPYATEDTNTTGELDQILTFQPEDGVRLLLRNLMEGGRVGIPLYLRLRDSNDDPIPINSSLTWMFKRPGDDTWTVVGRTRDNIQPWVTLTLAEQRNNDNAGATLLPLKGGDGQVLEVTDVQEVALALDSSVQVDWTNSQAYLDTEASRTRQE
jgi:hypothetical protein